jgi:hypothetical protein
MLSWPYTLLCIPTEKVKICAGLLNCLNYVFNTFHICTSVLIPNCSLSSNKVDKDTEKPVKMIGHSRISHYFEIKLCRIMVDLCHSYFRPATPPSEKSKINKLKWSERAVKKLISEGAGRSLINKTSPRGSAEQDLRNKTTDSRKENTIISGGAERS